MNYTKQFKNINFRTEKATQNEMIENKYSQNCCISHNVYLHFTIVMIVYC